jgi:type I restriction enzyme S subunit
MKTGFHIQSLGDVCEVIAGQSPPSSTYNLEGRGLPFFQGKADFGTLYPTVRVWCDVPSKIAQPNDILISVRAPVGPTNLCSSRACIGRGLSAIRAKNGTEVKYVLYYLRAIEPRLSKQGRGSTFSAITQSEIRNLKIPFPPLPIQKQIAAILEKADAAREKRRQANQLTEQFLQSAFLEMFGDPVTNPKGWKTGILGEAIEYSEYGTSVKSNDEKRGHAVIGMGNVTYEGLLDLNVLKHVELPDDEFKKLRLRQGDIIFNRTNSTELVGKTACWNLEMDAVIASYLVKLRLTRAFDHAWFSALLNTTYYKKLFMQRCRKAVGQSNISPTLLKEFPMYMPPLDEQKKFAAFVGKVDSLRAKQKESEKELENLFNSLMQKAFKGELV